MTSVTSRARQRRAHDVELRRRIAAAVAVYMRRQHLYRNVKRRKGKTRYRARLIWQARFDSLTEQEFLDRYRMDKATFTKVADGIRDAIDPRKDKQGKQRWSYNASRGAGPVTTELQLSATLRFLAGGYTYIRILCLF